MAKTLSQLREHARTYLDEVSAADWSDDQIDRELNYAYQEAVTSVINVFEDYYMQEWTPDLVANTSKYALPSDFIKIRRLEVSYVTGTERRKATRFAFESNARQWDSTNYGATSSPLYDLTGNYLRILPVPTANVTDGIYCEYIYQVPDMSASTDTINIPYPDRYGNLIVIGACAQLLRKGQQEEATAAKYEDVFQVGLAKMQAELEDRINDGPKMIVDTQGSWNDFSNALGSSVLSI